MSQSVATLVQAHGSKQIPRLFRGRHQQRTSTPIHRHEYEALLTTENVLATVKGNDSGGGGGAHYDHEGFDEDAIVQREASRLQSDKVLQQQINDHSTRAVEDIERWLKNINDPISSTRFNMKNNSRASMERYLSEQLPEIFFEKEFSSEDDGIANKKLNISYDTIFNELQNEKLLSACEKDDVFILPNLQLDNLDSLAYCTDDMILSGDILPSTSDQPTCTNINITNVNTKDLIIRLQETINRISDNNKIVQDIPTQNVAGELNDNQLKDGVNDCENLVHEDFCNTSLPTGIQDLCMENLSDNESNVDDPNCCTDFENNEVYTVESENLTLHPFDQTGSTNIRIKIRKLHPNKANSPSVKPKFQPSIIKRKRKLIDKEHTYSRKDMSVNVPTDEQSNITNIYINKTKSNEILKKPSSRYSIRLRKKSTNYDSCESEHEEYVLVRPLIYYNHQELAIAKALEEVGITDKMLKHVIIGDNVKVWQCHQDQCDRQFAKLCSLKAHLLTHFGVKPFKCDHEGCSWAFYSDFKLKRHKETHLKKKDYVCSMPGCKRRFTTVYNLASHEKLHTRPNRVSCQVPECGAKFQTKRSLESHMKTHDESLAPYVCSHEGCGKRYYGSSALMSHQRCHSYSPSDVTCYWPGCGKRFDHPCRLKTHVRSHTGCKPYACTFKGCKWAFSTSSKLNRHQKKHTNDRKFVCDVADCRKAFMRSEHLKDHKLTHTQERYFRCSHCEAAFSAKSTLYMHIKRHANKEFVGRGHNQAKKNKTAERKRPSKKEVQGSRVQPVRIAAGGPKKASLAEDGADNSATDVYSCPGDSCTKLYSTKASLRAHLLKKHVPAQSEICNGNASPVVPSSLLSQGDLVMFGAPPCATETPTDRIVLPPYEAVFHVDRAAESTISATSAQQTDSQVHLNLQDARSTTVQDEENEENIVRNEGSARTAFTCAYVLSLKPDRMVVGASDVVLGAADFGDGLLLSDVLPSVYCQEDIDVPGYQILLRDTGPVDSEISMRDLD